MWLTVGLWTEQTSIGWTLQVVWVWFRVGLQIEQTSIAWTLQVMWVWFRVGLQDRLRLQCGATAMKQAYIGLDAV